MLIRLHRYSVARKELARAVECLCQLGHTAEPWKTWSILEDLERTTGQTEAAHAAKQQAIKTYIAYRRAGGDSQSPGARLITLVTHALQENTESQARQVLDQLADDDNTPLFGRVLIARLKSVLAERYNIRLADDPELHFIDAAELQLLLEALGQGSTEGGPE